MRFWELASGLYTILTEEEDDLLVKIIKNQEGKLSEREEIIAQRLVHKDVLIREDDKNGDTFKVNYKVDIWRD